MYTVHTILMDTRTGWIKYYLLCTSVLTFPMGVVYKWDGKTTIQTTRKRLRKSASRKCKRGKNSIPQAWGRIDWQRGCAPRLRMRQAYETRETNTNEHTTMHHQYITGPLPTKAKKTSFIRQNWAEKKGPKHIKISFIWCSRSSLR